MSRSNPQVRKAFEIRDLRQTMPWGKYEGETIQEILDVDPKYLVWLHDNTDTDIDQSILDVANEMPRHEFSGFTKRYDPR